MLNQSQLENDNENSKPFGGNLSEIHEIATLSFVKNDPIDEELIALVGEEQK